MDEITAVEPVKATPQAPAIVAPEPSPEQQPAIEPLDHAEEPVVRSKLRTYAILLALYLVLFIAALDQTIIATSIPTISASLRSAAGYVWIGGAYLLASAAASPIWAKCSDIWGRKPVLLLAVALFAAASVLAALSTDMAMLIAARALQGVSGGGLVQMVYIVISDLFSMRDRSLQIGMLGMMWAVAGSSGPLIGGSLTQLVSWRWCFWINLPVCGLAFGLLLLFLDVHNPHTKLSTGLKALDWYGTFSVLAVTLLLLLGLDFGGTVFPWSSPKVICLIVFGALMIGFFLFSEKRLAKYPLMPLAVFRDRSNVACFLVGATHSMVAIGTEFYLPLYFQAVKQASPLRSGVLIVPMMVTEAVVDIGVGVLIHKTGRYREIGWVGVTLMTLGTGLYTRLDSNTSVAEIVGLEIVAGVGTAMLFQVPTISIQNSVSQADTATAISTLGLINKIATSLSIVLGGITFQNSMTSRHASLVTAGLDQTVLDALRGDHAAANVEIVKTIQDTAQREAVQGAFSLSVRNIFILYTCLSGVALVAGAFVKHKKLREEHTETKTGIPKGDEKKDNSAA